MFAQAFAAEVRAELAAQHLTANELATSLGLSAHTVGRRLSGAVSFSVVEMAKIAEIVGVAVDEMAARTEARTRRPREGVAS